MRVGRLIFGLFESEITRIKGSRRRNCLRSEAQGDKVRDSKSPSALPMENLSLVIELDFLQKDPSIDGKRRFVSVHNYPKRR